MLKRLPQYYKVKQKWLILAIFALFLSLTLLPFHSTSEKVISVQDGDSLVVSSEKNIKKRIRLYGIDAPEYRQYWGKEAQHFSDELAYQKEVSLQSMGQDQYGRELAIITLPDGKILNEELVREGHAWVYSHYCNTPQCTTWKELERQARKGHKGLWSQKNPLPPWIWRKKNKQN